MTDMDYREGDQYFVPDFEKPAEDAPVEERVEEPPAPPEEPVEEAAPSQVTVEGVPQPSYEVDAWGLSRNEWVNHPTLTIAHGPPRTDETGVWFDCREPGCDVSKPSISGLLMHRNRVHISDSMKKERFDKMSKAHKDAAKRRREAQNEMSPYVAEDPEVQAILAGTLVRGSNEFEARRKRWSKAKAKGVTEGQFAIKELERAIALAADPSIVEEDAPATTKKPRASKKVDEASQADDLFERVGRATDVLFPNGVDGAHILPVAELQKDMLALMQGVQS